MRITRLTSFAAVLLVLSMATQGQDADEIDEDEDLTDPLEQAVHVAEENADIAESAAEMNVPKPREEALAQGVDASEEDALMAEFARFRELIIEENFDAADASAKRVVEMAIRLHGPQSIETSKALSNLGLVQHNNKQYDPAIQNFSSAIEIIEDTADRLNMQLVNPLKGLGAAQLGNGRPDLAMETFVRASHITQVNEGPHNIDQIEILESVAEANVRLGDIEAARDVLNRIHALNVRHFEDDALGLLPSLMRRADWQHRAGYYNDERATYRRTIRIIEGSAGKEDARLVTPLVKLGETYYYYQPAVMNNNMMTTSGSSGEMFLKRAVRIAERTEDFPWFDQAMTKLALADYYSYFDSKNRSRKLYAEVWTELSENEDRLQVRREVMERPILLREESLPLYSSGGAEASPGQASTGTIRVDYTISSRGRVKSILSTARPPEFTDMQRLVHREVRNRFFRPPMVDGIPVDATNQVFIHDFFYQQSELNDMRDTASEEVAGNQE